MKIEETKKKPIPGWEGMYSATADGQIISEERRIKDPRGGEKTLKQKTLKPRLNTCGYSQVRVYRNSRGTLYLVHRLVAAAFGIIDIDDLKQQIDHIDGDKANNCLENLRAATNQQNTAYGSKLIRANNTSGYRGVTWNKQRKKWRAEIGVNGKQKHLGLFEDKLEAAAAYDEAAKKYFGEFAFSNL